jgi:esterase/lipase
VLGYSLGGLLSALAIAKGIVAAPDKLVLLAPAIGLRRWVRFFEPLTKILPGSLPLPSAVPPSYRAASFAAVSWYRVLFEFYHDLWRLGASGAMSDLPIRIYLSDRDEFISVLELERWIKEADLGDAELSIVKSQATISATPQHLLLEPSHFGAQGWAKWINEICSGAEST